MAFPLDHGKNFNEEDEDFKHAALLVSASVLPMTLKVAIELDLLEIIAKAGPEAQLSPAQIASQLPTHNPDAPTMVERILRLLASYSILRCSLFTHENGRTEPLYGLAPVCKLFTRNQEGFSMAPLLLMLQDKVFMESWYHMKDAVLNGGCPFDKAYGMTAFEYPSKDPRFNDLFNKGMSGAAAIIMSDILNTYKGFEGLRELLDVGGGIGSTIHLIISNHPHIKGLNYDLPHVIARAPAYSGVEHIGGDMFESVPRAETIFMKSILHDWGDEQCLKVLRNCYEALPESGKVIIVESVLPSVPETNLGPKFVYHADMFMLAVNPGGKERTKEQYESLAKGAGFASLNVACSTSYAFWVMECHKK